MNVIARVGLVAAMSLSLPGQEYVRWVEDLGDEERGEAAERKLLAMGDKVLRPIEEQLQQWGPTMSEDRCRSLLRMIRLLGHRAEPLAAPLKTAVTDWSGKFLAEAVDTLASLEPWAGDNEWHTLFHQNIGASDKQKGRAIAAFARLTSRQKVRQRDTFEDLKAELNKDRFAARAAAAEMMGKLGDKAAVELLHKRLLDRETKPKDWDQLRHNGFIMPLADQFALQAGLALIKLAPSDPRAAIGYANVALQHPHASVRLETVRQMAQLGPAASDAIPELLQLAKSDDHKLAAEAIKLLGMAGPKVGEHLREIRRLAKLDTGAAAQIANSLAKRLVAMGAKEPAEATQDTGELAALVAQLGNKTSEEVRAKIIAEPRAWKLLMQRFRKERMDAPDALFEVLEQIAWSRSEADREYLAGCVGAQGGNTWRANMMSTSSGGKKLTEVLKVTYARLKVDPSLELAPLTKLLKDEDAHVRLVAIQRLTARNSEWRTGEGFGEMRDRLIKAATSKHPRKMKIMMGGGHQTTIQVNIDKTVQAAAAEALADSVVPSDRAGDLLTAIRRGKDEELIAKAITKWAHEDARKQLKDAAKDKRASVAAAAKGALEQLTGK